MLWKPLFKNSENAEETTRNVAAACLGKLATTHPSRYLPQLHVCPLELRRNPNTNPILQARIRDENAATRATVISAIRYTFADTSQSYDDLLAPLIVDFLALIQDNDLVSHR
jgi:cullin-associated NEDD8-dissociated protein 1